MINVTSTLFIHRPQRKVFYLPETKQEINSDFLSGILPQSLEKFQYQYGTYGNPGIFYLSQDLKSKLGKDFVEGIEFRNEDSSLDYPKDLPSIILPDCDFIMIDLVYDNQLTSSFLKDIIPLIKNKKNPRSEYYHYTENGLVAVFPEKDKLRIMYEIERLDAPKSIRTSVEDYTKDELFKIAFSDGITDYHNWPWMWERFTTYHLDNINDYAFVHFDIKDFKMINELYNHQIANNLLTKISKNIKKHKDWIYYGARCDNDNFALMTKGLPETQLRQKLTDFFEELSVLEEDSQYKICFRCGVVTMFYAMNTGDIVADCAKIAQATGNQLNKTEINFYTKEIHEKVLWGKQLKAYLDTAIQNQEFLVYLQPKIDTKSEKIYGAEALIRWNYKNKGLMPPIKFIPYFELDDSIIKIDEIVLHQVCRKLKSWKEKGYSLHPISVNLSRKHLEQTNVAEHLTKIVDSYGIDHQYIEFELTESATNDNQKYMLSILQDLHNKGFLISMDDFGTGYSSFGLLKEMPLDTLKIDKSFVDFIAVEKEPNKNKIILQHIISMANALGIHCVAEGAEYYEQIKILENLGCNTVQGFYYSKPIPMEDFEENYISSN